MLKADHCRTLNFVPFFVGKALKRHISTPNYELCQIECFSEGRCVSYNCRGVSCELNSADHIEHPEDLEDEKGSHYRAAEFCRFENVLEYISRRICSRLWIIDGIDRLIWLISTRVALRLKQLGRLLYCCGGVGKWTTSSQLYQLAQALCY